MLSLTHLPQSRFHPHPIHPCFPYDIFLNLSLFEMLHLRSESPLFIIMFSSHNQKSTLKTVSKTGLYPLTQRRPSWCKQGGHFYFLLDVIFFLKLRVTAKIVYSILWKAHRRVNCSIETMAG